jgi:hypothetical protein
MGNFCRHCGKPLSPASKICQCGTLVTNYSTEVHVEKAQEEKIIEEVQRQILASKEFHDGITKDRGFLWRVSWRTFFAFFTLIGIVFGWGIWQSVQGLNQASKDRFDALDRNMSNLVARANARIETNIAQRFTEASVSNTVDRVAAAQAKEMMIKQLQPEVERFRSDMDSKLSSLRTDYEKAQNKVKEIEELTAGIEKLPDGRVVLGGMITGRASLLFRDMEKLAEFNNAAKFEQSYPFAIAAIKKYEDSLELSKGGVASIGDVVPSVDGVCQMYWMGAQAAINTKNTNIAVTWARKAVQAKPTSTANVVLLRALTASGLSEDAANLIKEIDARGGDDAAEFKRLLIQ